MLGASSSCFFLFLTLVILEVKGKDFLVETKDNENGGNNVANEADGYDLIEPVERYFRKPKGDISSKYLFFQWRLCYGPKK